MGNRELETTTLTRSHLRRQGGERRVAEPDAPALLTPQHDPLAQVLARGSGALSVGVYASALRRVAVAQPSRTAQSLLQLQRSYGNRYVQRLVALVQKADGEAEAPPEVEDAIQRMRGGGQALDTKVRAQMESTFGADFSGVRVHTGSEADTLNRALSARAFTTGQDIFLRQGEYSPGSSHGRELLAHELTHVVQQRGDEIQRKLVVGEPGDKYEQEADQVARMVVQKEEAGERTRRQVEEAEEEERLV